MKKVSRITVCIFCLLFVSLLFLRSNPNPRYGEKDFTALHLWYEGSMYKAKKEYSVAKKYYIQALEVAENVRLRNEIISMVGYLNKYLDKKGVASWQAVY